jgi:effector-binding domain-containing protein
MQIFKKILILLLSILLLIVIIGFFLPNSTVVSRSAEINKPVDVPFRLINHLPSWQLWSPWFAMDTTAEYIYSSPDEGTGSYYTWTSNNKDVGSGKMIIDLSEQNKKIEVTLLFNEWGNAKSRFEFERINEQTTRIIWIMESYHGWNIFERWFGIFLDRMLGKDFEQGLAKITEVSESIIEKELIGGFESEIRELPEQRVMGLRYKISPLKLTSDIFNKSFASLLDFSIKSNIELDGMPMVIYYDINEKSLDFETAIPIRSELTSKGRFIIHTIPATKALVVTYKGAYDQMNPLYEAAYEYIANNSLVLNDAIREIYITDSQVDADTANWITEIVFPVK